MGDFTQQIIALPSSRHYHELAAYHPPFDPMEVLGVSGRELSYSSVLAWLLRDPANRRFRQCFLFSVAEKLKFDLEASNKELDFNEPARNLLNAVSDRDFAIEDEPIEVEREYGDQEAGRIDVLVNFPRSKLVVAIEVKVWAEEGQDQISRYQGFLCRRFDDKYCKLVIFLTPYGDKPLSKDKASRVPVLEMSWRAVADMLGKCLGRGEESDFRAQFGTHIYRSVLMHDKNKRKIVIDLLKQGDNATIIKTIIDNYPKLSDDEYVDRWKKIVSKAVGSEEELEVQKFRADSKELKIKVPRWSNAGLPFTLMLYKYMKAGVRVLLLDGEYENNKDKLKEFSASSSDVVGDFPRVANWPVWHSVIKSHGDQEEPLEILIDKEIFEECFWVQAEQKLKEQLCPLKPHIVRWVANYPNGSKGEQ